MGIVEEQWDEMIHVATSLKERTAPAHVVVERLTLPQIPPECSNEHQESKGICFIFSWCFSGKWISC
jgi:hypothetical protein